MGSPNIQAILDRIRASSRTPAPSSTAYDPPPEFEAFSFDDVPMPPPERGMLRRAYDWASTPLTDFSSWGRRKATELTDPNRDPSMLSGFAGGALEGLTNVVDSFTSPLGLASTVSGAAAPMAATRGLTSAARALRTIDALTAAPAVAGGLYDAATGEDMGDVARGLATAGVGAAGGALALRGAGPRGTVKPRGPQLEELTPGGLTYRDIQARPMGGISPSTSIEDLPWSRQTMPRHTPAPIRGGDLARGAERYVGPDMLRPDSGIDIPEGPITTGLDRPMPRGEGTRQAPYEWVRDMEAGELARIRQALGLPEQTPRRQMFPDYTQLEEGMTPEPFSPYERPSPMPPLPGSRSSAMDLAGARQPTFEVLDPYSSRLNANASGESAASIEALNRQRSMQGKGETFVVYNAAGQRRPLIGPDAVDYVARQGETYGIEGPSGFRVLDDLGGRPPAPPAAMVGRPPVDLGGGVGSGGGVGTAVLEAPPQTATGLTEIDDLIAGLDAPAPVRRTPEQQIEEILRKAHGELMPKWEASLAKQAGDDIPFTVDPRVPFEEFARDVREAPDPRALWSTERKARTAIDEILAKAGDESGFITPEMLLPILKTIVGGGAGSVIGAGLNEDNRMLGALEGGALGAAVMNPRALARLIPQLQGSRYFSMLSSPMTHAKNVAGAAGAVGGEALERGLTGDVQGATDVLRNAFSKETIGDIIAEFKAPQFASTAGDPKWGPIEGLLGLPARAMSAVDAGATRALERSGLTPEDARSVTFTNQPKSKTGQYLVSRPGLLSLPIPFPKVATNIIERGIERTPILGSVAEQLSGGALKTSMPKQAIGLAAMLAAANAGELPPLVQALLAPYALPTSMGAAIGAKGNEDADATLFDRLKAGGEAFLESSPLPSDTFAYDPARWLAQLVPNLGKDISSALGTDPQSFETRGSLLAPALAKVPILNELLLDQKGGRAPRASTRTTRAKRER